MAETKVPGEPLFFQSEAGWRPYLPLPDQILSALIRGQRTQIYTPEGLTTVLPPHGVGRFSAWARLTFNYRAYARLRNWREDDPSAPSAYVRALSASGVLVRFEPHTGRKADPAVTRFFSSGAPFSWEFVERIRDYFYSVYENSLGELGLFTLAAGGLFFGRHIYLNRLQHQNRQAIPLVIGGWGTRGKSGTERLKAALLNAVGLSLISKTTGCEAMILYASPFGKLRELFLFRPYDKATIWEQHNVVHLATKLGVQAFLWECMALTPQYVRILQRDWMKDDLSTITNTFPDHEDLQGPAGINIPEVIADFIPTGSKLITSERQMLPILQDAARAKRSHLLPVTWRDSSLIPSDVLARFPYQEHPDNIALVAAMASELGLSREFAWKEMADRVVPDLGVLKTSAPARLRSRTLEFSNGMSANERFGSLGNWQRLGFDQHDIERQPEVWISAVVNNRGDRVPRSKVFAGIMVTDISVDRYYLIGSNLSGLMGFVREAWQNTLNRLTLWPKSDEGCAPPRQQLIRLARAFRIPWNRAVAVNRLRCMIDGQYSERPFPNFNLDQQTSSQLQATLAAAGCPHVDEIISAFDKDLDAAADFEKLQQQLDSDSDPSLVDQQLTKTVSKWFFAKFVVIEDYYATGNQIVDMIGKSTPPGLRNRIMGMQNIKGTGLDFVYTWQAWDACYQACAQLLSDNPALVEKGLAALSNFEGFNLLCEEHVRRTVQLKQSASEAALQPQLTAIFHRMDKALEKIRQQITLVRSTGWTDKLMDWTESWVDALDAVRRRTRANRIYNDLSAERISQARAALELQQLSLRQKGGWLRKKLS